MNEESLLYILALTKVPNVGPVIAKNLIGYCGGAKEVFSEKKSRIQKIPKIGPGIASAVSNKKYLEEAEKDLEFCVKHRINVYHYKDKRYPQRLVHYEDSPIMLFYKGNADLNHFRIVSVIGTRNPSEYGKIQCERITEGLLDYKALLLSGLAYGIDSIAHRKAVTLKIPTIAVLGHGLDRIYPAQNKNLAREIISCGGLLTEFSIRTKPDRENFPMRNRIIAGMSDAIVVIESGRKGGSIITAEFSNSYNKDVFALPGRVNDEKSIGTNRLIKQHKANLIESAADIGYIMRWEQEETPVAAQVNMFPDLDPQQKLILDYIQEKGDVKIDKMHVELKLPHSQLARTLLELEMKGVIKTLPGKQYRVI